MGRQKEDPQAATRNYMNHEIGAHERQYKQQVEMDKTMAQGIIRHWLNEFMSVGISIIDYKFFSPETGAYCKAQTMRQICTGVLQHLTQDDAKKIAWLLYEFPTKCFKHVFNEMSMQDIVTMLCQKQMKVVFETSNGNKRSKNCLQHLFTTMMGWQRGNMYQNNKKKIHPWQVMSKRPGHAPETLNQTPTTEVFYLVNNDTHDTITVSVSQIDMKHTLAYIRCFILL